MTEHLETPIHDERYLYTVSPRFFKAQETLLKPGEALVRGVLALPDETGRNKPLTPQTLTRLYLEFRALYEDLLRAAQMLHDEMHELTGFETLSEWCERCEVSLKPDDFLSAASALQREAEIYGVEVRGDAYPVQFIAQVMSQVLKVNENTQETAQETLH